MRRSAVFPSIFLEAVSLPFEGLRAVSPSYRSNRDPDPSTHRQAQGGEEDRTTMLRVMVRYSNHEAQTRRELGRSLASEIFLTSLQTAFFNNLLDKHHNSS